jgi:hypothetical protein
MNWGRVRALGELQVLTRASYFMLFFVPLLAGLWPGVRLVVNKYNQAVTDATAALESASDRLESQAQRLERLLADGREKLQWAELGEKATEIVRSTDARIQDLLSDYSMKAIERVALPDVWALAFLASLMVLLAHMLYQMWAPHLVRQSGMRQYALDQRNRYAENPSDGLLKRASDSLTSERRSTIGAEPQQGTPMSDERRRWELDVVEEGSRDEYVSIAKRYIGRAWFVAFLYAIGIGIVLYIAWIQTLSVLRAAEWIC